MKITAAILDATPQTWPYAETGALRLAEIELAAPGANELLVRIDAAGLCHSDLSVINGDRLRPVPMALGHEAVATVLECGGNCAGHFAAGDRVVLTFLPACGHCRECLSGESYLCANGAIENGQGTLLEGAIRLSEHGRPVHHHLGVSAFPTHAVIDRRSAVKIDRDIPVEIAALFGCAVLTGVGAVLNTANLRAGECVAIYGLGGVGLSALMGAVAGGAQPIVVIDPVAEKRALALELGAAAAFHPGEGEAAIIAACGGVRPDLVVESVGNARVLEQAYALARRGGRIVTVGLPNPAEMLSIKAVSLVGDGKTLMGSYMGSAIPSRDIPRYIALWRAGRLPIDRLLSSVSPLSEINGLFDRLAAGGAIRQIVIPESQIADQPVIR
jgi:Zn-dependent alcohol dehydrogenase